MNDSAIRVQNHSNMPQSIGPTAPTCPTLCLVRCAVQRALSRGQQLVDQAVQEVHSPLALRREPRVQFLAAVEARDLRSAGAPRLEGAGGASAQKKPALERG